MNWYMVSWKREWEDEYRSELIFGAEDTLRKDIATLKDTSERDVHISSIYKYSIIVTSNTWGTC